MSPSVAIVGAGAAGAAAAYALRDEPVDVAVFEKRQGVSGRAATRRREGCVYDCGAGALEDGDDAVTTLVTEDLAGEGPVRIEEPVLRVDEDGRLGSVDDGTTRWTWEAGLDELGERLLDASGAAVSRETRIDLLDREDSGWRLADAEATDQGQYDAVLLTPPAPQTADLLGAAAWQHDACRALREAVAVVPFRTVVTAVLHYDFALDRPWYALDGRDNDRDLRWVARESCKPGRVPDGEGLLVVQMGHDWSVEHFEDGGQPVVEAAASGVASLLDEERLATPDWTDRRQWRYALADGRLRDRASEAAAEHDIFLAGDWVAGDPRLHRALASGLRAGDRIARHL
jgi:predicted NAD/FAD-dependent oxidoreductase